MDQSSKLPPGTGVSASGLPGNLDLAGAMRIMDVASALRRESEAVETLFNHDQVRARLRETLTRTANVTGESLTPEQLEAAIDWYFDNLHEYKPPPAGIATTLAHLYVRRGMVFAWTCGLTLLALAGWWLAASSSSPVSPAGRRARQQAEERKTEQRAAGAARQRAEEFEQAAADLQQEADVILTLTSNDEVKQQVARALAQIPVYRRNLETAPLRDLKNKLAEVHQLLNREYTVWVFAGEGKRSAFERHFEDEQGKRLSGHYLIVEARDGRGQIVRRRIRNSETGEDSVVAQWAERVPEEVYERLKADKLADGILNETRFAEKKAGELEEHVVMPAAGGVPLQRDAQITRW